MGWSLTSLRHGTIRAPRSTIKMSSPTSSWQKERMLAITPRSTIKMESPTSSWQKERMLAISLQAFKALDHNNDAEISHREFRELMHVFSDGDDQDTARSLNAFHEHDSNFDGVLNYSEFVNLLMNV